MQVPVYEPVLRERSVFGSAALTDLAAIKAQSDLFVGNNLIAAIECVHGEIDQLILPWAVVVLNLSDVGRSPMVPGVLETAR